MCGFAGFVSASPEGPRVLQAMTQTMVHRGPDDSANWVDERSGVHLGFRRLSIRDLSVAGRQPMASASGRFIIVFNGEIYNPEDLMARIGGLETRRGHSDTEILLESCERLGVRDTVDVANGMFAFALWDRERRELWLARDRLGIKPLYLHETATSVAFASELRAFHAYPSCSAKGNAEAAMAFMARLYVPSPLSILEDVRKVSAGHLLRFKVHGFGATLMSDEHFWTPATFAVQGPSDSMTPDQAVERLDALLRDSVSRRMVADVPVGALLSGGIDSTAVTSIMTQVAQSEVRTYTISFEDKRFDEGDRALKLATHLGCNHTQVSFGTTDLLSGLLSLPAQSDEPMANPSLLPTTLISQVASDGVVVALTGDGGDELFGGYNRYVLGQTLLRWRRRLPAQARSSLARLIRSSSAKMFADQVQAAWPTRPWGRQQSTAERLQKVAGVLEAGSDALAYDALLSVGLMAPTLDVAGAPRFDYALDDYMSKMMLADQLQYLPDDLLTKVDRASMWASLEARVPLLDHRVVEFSWQLPRSLKLNHGVPKWPLREVALRYVPRELLDGPKMGFTVPIADWMKCDLREWARDTLSTESVKRTGVLCPQEVNELWARLDAGDDASAIGLWAAATLQAWSDSWKVTFG